MSLAEPLLSLLDPRTYPHPCGEIELIETHPHPKLVLSFTRQQGFLIGRGNQQLSVEFLRRLSWPADVTVVGTRTKLLTLSQRPLQLDSGDPALDTRLAGMLPVLTGYDDRILYRVAAAG